MVNKKRSPAAIYVQNRAIVDRWKQLRDKAGFSTCHEFCVHLLDHESNRLINNNQSFAQTLPPGLLVKLGEQIASNEQSTDATTEQSDVPKQFQLMVTYLVTTNSGGATSQPLDIPANETDHAQNQEYPEADGNPDLNTLFSLPLSETAAVSVSSEQEQSHPDTAEPIPSQIDTQLFFNEDQEAVLINNEHQDSNFQVITLTEEQLKELGILELNDAPANKPSDEFQSGLLDAKIVAFTGNTDSGAQLISTSISNGVIVQSNSLNITELAGDSESSSDSDVSWIERDDSKPKAPKSYLISDEESTYSKRFIAYRGPADKKTTYHCSLCGERFLGNAAYQRHVKADHNPEKFLMEAEGGQGTKPKRRRGSSGVIGNQNFTCLVCGAKFLRRNSEIRHFSVKHGRGLGDYPCYQCSLKFPRKGDLWQHCVDDHGLIDDRIRCPICNKLTNRANHDQHKQKFHPGALGAFVICEFCGDSFDEAAIHDHRKGDILLCMNTPAEVSVSCELCWISFDSEEAFVQHIMDTHKESEKQFCFCNLCGKHYKRIEKLKKHLLLFHDSRKQVSCIKCFQRFSSAELMRAHVRRIHILQKETGVFRCKPCGKEFSDYKQLYSHKIDAHSYRVWNKGVKKPKVHKVCEQADETFSDGLPAAGNYPTEPNVVHPDYTVQSSAEINCELLFDSQANTSEGALISIPAASETFPLASSEFLMTSEGFGPGYRTTVITVTDAGETSEYYLADSSFIVTNEDGTEVNISIPDNLEGSVEQSASPVKRKKRPKGLQYNQNKVKRESMKQSVICEGCGKRLWSEAMVRRHDVLHAGGRPHACQYCGREFKCMNNLKNHTKRIHEGGVEKNHVCEKCGSRFFTGKEHLRHMQRHAKYDHRQEHSLKCELCQKQLKNWKNFDAHMQTHNADNTHVCPVCDKGFRSIATMRAHRRNAHEGRYVYKRIRRNVISQAQENADLVQNECDFAAISLLTEG